VSSTSTRTARSLGGGSTASAASTSRRGRRPDICTLADGAAVRGVVRGLTTFGAFVDVGCSRDGLLHVSEAAELQLARLCVGQRLDLFVKRVDPLKGKLSLSARPLDKERAAREARWAAEREAAARERARREAQQQARREEEARQEEAARRLAEAEAAKTEEARAREAAAAAAREAAGLSLPMASLVGGASLPPPPAPPPREILARRFVRGRGTLTLFKMPWATRCC